MPEGVVQWFDRTTGEGRVVRRGHRYVVHAEDMETGARAPGARVHFDVARGQHDVAVNVSLRAGRRMRPHHRRFGQTTGARSSDTAGGLPSTYRLTELGHGLEQHPMRAAELWASLLADADVVNLARLYAPGATLMADGGVVVGTRAIRRYWESSPLLAGSRAVVTGGDDGAMVLTWPVDHGDTAPASRMWIEHGEIVEQWLGSVAEMVVATDGGDETPLTVSASGAVTAVEWNYAIDKIGGLLRRIGSPVLFASVRLDRSADPARERGAVAKATIDLDGRPVRAHVAATGMVEAIDLLEARLIDRLRHLADHERAKRRRGPEPLEGGWRHGDPVAPRPAYFPRPVDEREVVRHKTWTTVESTPDEAVFDMESLDYDFLLFADLASGEDAVVWRADDGYRLRRLGTADLEQPSTAEVEVDPTPTPTLTLAEARARLDVGDERWLFYRDSATGRGHVLYRRYDGHYGVITPAAIA